MADNVFAAGFAGRRLHLVGIKGVGMTALAEILQARGARLTGSDTSEVFFTDEILKGLGIPVTEGFDEKNLSAGTELVIHSAAYSPAEHPELKRARALGIPTLTYPEALGRLSELFDSAGVSGVHGKTTTTAMAGMLCRELGLGATILVGSEVGGFGHRSTFSGGDRFLVAETCEYKRHFLNFSPSRLILTSIEMDHQDYFKDLADIEDAFTVYALRLKPGGALIHCADDPGVERVVSLVKDRRSDMRFVPYGFNASGDYRITDLRFEPGTTHFRLNQSGDPFALHLPGRHTVLNAAAAVALVRDLVTAERGAIGAGDEAALRRALAAFTGTRRRSEIVGEAAGILFMDDYAHHPTAIRTTLAGLKDYYPHRRLVVDFMSHTYSRTRALLDQFASSFSQADEVILHKIYASARERNDGRVSGRSLYDLVLANKVPARYFEETGEAFPHLTKTLKAGDLFITMGAGDNWKLGRDLYQHFKDARSAT